MPRKKKWIDNYEYVFNDEEAIRHLLKGYGVRLKRWRIKNLRKPTVYMWLSPNRRRLTDQIAYGPGTIPAASKDREEKWAVVPLEMDFKKFPKGAIERELCYKIPELETMDEWQKMEVLSMKMNDKEALEALLEKKAIRQKDWPKNKYLFLRKGALLWNDLSEGSFQSSFDWEVTKPLLKLNKAGLYELVKDFNLDIPETLIDRVLSAIEEKYHIE